MVAQETQLKILQTLPALHQNYPNELSGDLLAVVLEICATLQSSKNVAVSNSAAATLQQLVVSVFDKVGSEENISKSHWLFRKTVQRQSLTFFFRIK